MMASRSTKKSAKEDDEACRRRRPPANGTAMQPEDAEVWRRCRLCVTGGVSAAHRYCASSVPWVRHDLPRHTRTCTLSPLRTQPRMECRPHRREPERPKATTEGSKSWNTQREKEKDEVEEVSKSWQASKMQAKGAKKVIEPEDAEVRRRCRLCVYCEENAVHRSCASSGLGCSPIFHNTHGRAFSAHRRRNRGWSLDWASTQGPKSRYPNLNTSGWNRRLGGPRTAKCSPIFRAAVRGGAIGTAKQKQQQQQQQQRQRGGKNAPTHLNASGWNRRLGLPDGEMLANFSIGPPELFYTAREAKQLQMDDEEDEEEEDKRHTRWELQFCTDETNK